MPPGRKKEATSEATGGGSKRQKTESIAHLDQDAPLATLVGKSWHSTSSSAAASSSGNNARGKQALQLQGKATGNRSQRIEPQACAGHKQERPRMAHPELVCDVVVGYLGDKTEDPPPVRFVEAGNEMKPGEVIARQSGEIKKRFCTSPIAKANRLKYNWVSQTEGFRFTRDPEKMLPFIQGEGQIGAWSCDVCGKLCSEQLFIFRAYLRREFLKESGPRRLDPFVAYISKRCGRGLLGALTETARFKEEIFGLTSESMSVDEVRAQLEEAFLKGGKEGRSNLMEELERLAGIGPGTQRKSIEMTTVEQLVADSLSAASRNTVAPPVLLHTAEDVFRAVARSLAPRVGARLLAMGAVMMAQAEKRETSQSLGSSYLDTVAKALHKGDALPMAPVHWPLEEAIVCLDFLLKAINGTSGLSQETSGVVSVRVDLAASWETTGLRRFGPSDASVHVRLGYLQGRKALHAFTGPKITKEDAAAICQRLEQLTGQVFPPVKVMPSLKTASGEFRMPGIRRLERAKELGFGWHSSDWAQKLKELLSVSFDFSGRPLNLVTGCSGAEAPHWALQELVGEASFRQLWAAEINENPRRFILRNCNTGHLYEDICYVMRGGGQCARHGGHCKLPHDEVDVFVAGFPCTPYSFCNPKRFKRNCFTEPAAKPFFEVRKFIVDRQPRLVILENVRGLLAPNPETDCSPMDFILRGRNPDTPEDCYEGTEPGAEWGLEYIKGYGLQWDMFYSSDWGLPQARPRIYIVMVREDAGGQRAADRMFQILKSCMGRLPCGAMNDFMFPPDDERVEKAQKYYEEKAARKKGRAPCSRYTEALFRTKRQELGLKQDDRPYSGSQAPNWFPHGTEKMVQQLDIVHVIAERQGMDRNFLLADLSQQVSRGAWRDDGNIPTLTTCCQFYSFAQHRLLLGEECLWLNGFPIERLNLDEHTEAERIFLAGNAMSVPVVGAVIFAGLAALDWGPGRSSSASEELPEPVAQRADVRQLAGVSASSFTVRCTQALLNDDDTGAVEAALEETKEGAQKQEADDADDAMGREDSAEAKARAFQRRAAVLVSLAREMANGQQQTVRTSKLGGSGEQKGHTKGERASSSATTLTGLMQAGNSDSDAEEGNVVGDRLGWPERRELVQSGKAPTDKTWKWLRESHSLLVSMSKEERTASVGVVKFVATAMATVNNLSLDRIAELCLSEVVLWAWTDLRERQALPLFGRILADRLGREARAKHLELKLMSKDEWWKSAAQLSGFGLEQARAQVLQDLRAWPPLLGQLLKGILQAWKVDISCSDEEIKSVTGTLTVLLEAWKTPSSQILVNLEEMLGVVLAVEELAKSCEAAKKPVTAKAFRDLDRTTMEEAVLARLLWHLERSDLDSIRDFISPAVNNGQVMLQCRQHGCAIEELIVLSAGLPQVDVMWQVASMPNEWQTAAACGLADALSFLDDGSSTLAPVIQALNQSIASCGDHWRSLVAQVYQADRETLVNRQAAAHRARQLVHQRRQEAARKAEAERQHELKLREVAAQLAEGRLQLEKHITDHFAAKPKENSEIAKWASALNKMAKEYTRSMPPPELVQKDREIEATLKQAEEFKQKFCEEARQLQDRWARAESLCEYLKSCGCEAGFKDWGGLYGRMVQSENLHFSNLLEEMRQGGVSLVDAENVLAEADEVLSQELVLAQGAKAVVGSGGLRYFIAANQTTWTWPKGCIVLPPPLPIQEPVRPPEPEPDQAEEEEEDESEDAGRPSKRPMPIQSKAASKAKSAPPATDQGELPTPSLGSPSPPDHDGEEEEQEASPPSLPQSHSGPRHLPPPPPPAPAKAGPRVVRPPKHQGHSSWEGSAGPDKSSRSRTRSRSPKWNNSKEASWNDSWKRSWRDSHDSGGASSWKEDAWKSEWKDSWKDSSTSSWDAKPGSSEDPRSPIHESEARSWDDYGKRSWDSWEGSQNKSTEDTRSDWWANQKESWKENHSQETSQGQSWESWENSRSESWQGSSQQESWHDSWKKQDGARQSSPEKREDWQDWKSSSGWKASWESDDRSKSWYDNNSDGRDYSSQARSPPVPPPPPQVDSHMGGAAVASMPPRSGPRPPPGPPPDLIAGPVPSTVALAAASPKAAPAPPTSPAVADPEPAAPIAPMAHTSMKAAPAVPPAAKAAPTAASSASHHAKGSPTPTETPVAVKATPVNASPPASAPAKATPGKATPTVPSVHAKSAAKATLASLKASPPAAGAANAPAGASESPATAAPDPQPPAPQLIKGTKLKSELKKEKQIQEEEIDPELAGLFDAPMEAANFIVPTKLGSKR